MSKRKVSDKSKTLNTKDKDHPLQANVLSVQHHSLKVLICLSLVVATLVVFWPVGNHGFIDLDDDVYVYNNPQVKAGLTLKGVTWAFTSLETSNWHPLTWLSHMLDCQLYGLNSGWHHLSNLLFHMANTLLLFWVLKRMTRKFWASSFVAALFALHPLHVESVAWVAERKDVLSTFFWMLTLWAYLRYVERPGFDGYLLAILFFVLGLLSKPMLVTLPFVLLLLDYWPLGRFASEQPSSQGDSSTRQSVNWKGQRWFSHRLVLEKVPFFFLAAVSSVITFVAQQSAGAVKELEWFPLEGRIGNALLSYLTYIGKMIWPHPLAVYYPLPDILLMWQAAVAAILLLGISFFVFRWGRTRRYLVVGWLWYLGTLVPVIGLVQVGAQAMADRYTYVPLIGLFIMIAWGVPDILAGWRYRKATLAISAGLLLLIFMVVTSLQVQKWHDGITLFTHTLKVTNRNAIIHYNLGVALSAQKKDGEAMVHYKEALRIEPNYVEAHNNLGVTLARQGKTQEAIVHYTEALRIDPNFADAHYNLGNVLSVQGKTQEAIAHYTEALRIKADDSEAHISLANSLVELRRTAEAIPHYTEALRINPHNAEVHNHLGIALARQGKNQEALFHFGEALRINPNFAEAHCNLGNVLSLQGKTQEAIAHYTEALRIKPDLAEAHFSLGLAYATVGNRSSALEEYKILKRINPEMANGFAREFLK